MKPRHRTILWDDDDEDFEQERAHSETEPVVENDSDNFECWFLGGVMVLRRDLDHGLVRVV